MHRDMDLVRELLIKLESDQKLNGTRWIQYTPKELGVSDRSAEEVGYHLGLLVEEGFVRGVVGTEIIPPISKLTWQGHEFLEDIRDPDIWSKTKERASSPW